LREFLKAEQIAASAVIVSIGREKGHSQGHSFFPPVASGRGEAALVRFQATKDVYRSPRYARRSIMSIGR